MSMTSEQVEKLFVFIGRVETKFDHGEQKFEEMQKDIDSLQSLNSDHAVCLESQKKKKKLWEERKTAIITAAVVIMMGWIGSVVTMLLMYFKPIP